MQVQKSTQAELSMERAHLRDLYNLLVRSVREAQNLQNLLEKERQMRRLKRYLTPSRSAQT